MPIAGDISRQDRHGLLRKNKRKKNYYGHDFKRNYEIR
jgi:hypothetical protein